MNVFFAHPRAYPDSVIDRTVADLAARLGHPVTAGRDDYKLRGSVLGWEAWERDVAIGFDPMTREPRFSVFIVPELSCGRATATIVRLALQAGKPVFFFGSQEAREIVAVQDTGTDNWKSGWNLVIA